MSTIEEKNELLLKEGLNLGAPLGDVQELPDGGGKQVREFGTIYFNPRWGTAFECHGAIRDSYIELGEEESALGYPISDEIDDSDVAGGRMNEFERGRLFFDPVDGITVQFFTPQVIVKITDLIPITLGQGETLNLQQFGNIAGLGGGSVIAIIADLLPDLEFRRVFDSLSPNELAELVARATEQDKSYVPPTFENFLEIICPAGFDTKPLIAAFEQLPGLVDFARESMRTEPAGVVGTSNPKFGLQGYLSPAPVGISAQRAWAKGADGSDLRLIDIEHAWFFLHEDLPPVGLLRGFNDTKEQGHGTAVLGVIGAIDNGVGIVGIAPATDIDVISVLETATLAVGMERVASMIAFAAKELRFGGVLLLELQQGLRPVELDTMIYHTIDMVTRGGVIVVEAAGNGGHNLDNEAFLGDSGAIIVGACRSTVPHGRWVTPKSASNFGARIDCNAWGENVHTAGREKDPVGRSDYFDFTGTSAAASIIAGVCLLVQHLHLIRLGLPGGSPLNPGRMREIISNPDNGTASAIPFVDRIGVMPDLAKIIANESL